MTPLHRRLAWSAGLGIFLDGYDLVIISVALMQLKAQWELTPGELGAIGGAVFYGALIGALAGGWVADKFGRKAVYMIDLLTFLVGAVLCGLAWSVAALVAFRFIVGVGIGADYPLSATYMAEFMPAKKRGGILTWTWGLWAAGAITAGLVGAALLLDKTNGWRWMFILGAIPAVLVVYLRRDLPESPRWYLRKNQPEKAAAVVARIDPTISQGEIDQFLTEQRLKMQHKPLPLKFLFMKPYLRATLLVCLPWFILDFVGYYITIYTPLILGRLGIHSEIARSLAQSVIFGSFIFGWIPLALLVDKIGRIIPQIIGFIGFGAALVLVALASTHVQHLTVDGKLTMVASGGTIAVVCVAMFLQEVFNTFGPASTTYILPSEVYPTDLRASGHGFATAFSRFGGMLGASLLPPVQVWLGDRDFFILLAAFCVLAAIFTWAFRIDTRGKALLQDAVHDGQHAFPTAAPATEPVSPSEPGV